MKNSQIIKQSERLPYDDSGRCCCPAPDSRQGEANERQNAVWANDIQRKEKMPQCEQLADPRRSCTSKRAR